MATIELDPCFLSRLLSYFRTCQECSDPFMLTDQRLIDGLRGDDSREVFLDFVRQNQRSLLAFIYLLIQDPTQAKTLTQEIFLNCLEHIRKHQTASGLRAWLYQQAYRRCVAINPTNHQRPHHDSNPITLAMKHLGLPIKSALFMRFGCGLAWDEMSLALGQSLTDIRDSCYEGLDLLFQLTNSSAIRSHSFKH